MLNVRRTIQALFNPFSSSAPEVKLECASSIIENTDEDSPPPEDMAGLSPKNYEDAAEELNRIEVTPPPPAKKDKSAKKAKKSKKAKQIQQVEEPEVDDLDLSSHFDKIGSIAAGLAGGVDSNMDMDAEPEAPQPPKTKKKKSGLSKRDRKMMEENQKNGYLQDEVEAMVDKIPEILELPAKIKKAKKGKKKSLDRAATPPVHEDDSALLQQQLSPAKPMAPLQDFSQEIPDVSMDDILVQDEEEIATATAPIAQNKKKSNKRTHLESLGEVPASKKKSKRSRIEEADHDNIHAILSAQPVVDALDSFVRKSKAQNAAERSSPPPSARNFDIIVPSSPRDSDLPPIPPTKSSKNTTTENRPKTSKKRKLKPVAAGQDLTDIPSGQPEPPEGDTSDEAEKQPEPETEPETDYEMPPDSQSSARRKRRMPVDDNDEESTPTQQKSRSGKSVKKTPAKVASSQRSSVPAPRTGKMTPEDTTRIARTIENYRDLNDLDQETLFEIIHDNASKKNSKPFEFWLDLWSAVPHLPRRNVQSYVRRGYHNHRKDPWTEEDDNDLDMVYHQVKEKQSVSGGFWKTIGNALDRYSEDCRDRWRTYAACKNRNIGPWSLREEERLRKAIDSVKKEYREALRKANGEPKSGSKSLLEDPEPNWMEVAKKMGGTRTRLQCLNKWQNLQEREDADGEDRVALAPVSGTPWRARPALQEAQAMSLQEKIHLLSLISGSGAAREGKIPWRSFPDSKGNVLVWKTFLRGVLYSVPADEDTTFQDRIAYLLERHEAKEPVEFDAEAAEFEALKLSRKSPTKKSAVTPKIVDESEDDVEEEEEVGEELPKPLRERMKKDGESQETSNGYHGGNSDENMSDVMNQIRNSEKKAPKSSKKGKERVSHSPMSSLHDDNDIPASSYLVTKSRKNKKAKLARQPDDAIMEEVEEETEINEPNHPTLATDPMQLDTEEVSEEVSSARELKKKSKKSKVVPIEPGQEADFEQKPVNEDIPNGKDKKSKKRKKTAVIEEPENPDETVDQYIDPMIEEEPLVEPLNDETQAPTPSHSENEPPREKKKKTKKAKKAAMLEAPVSDHEQDFLDDSNQNFPETSIQEQDESMVDEPTTLDSPSRNKKSKANGSSSVEESLENGVADPTSLEAGEEYATAGLIAEQTPKGKNEISKSKVAVPGPLELEEDPIEDFAEPVFDASAAILPPLSKKKKAKKSKKDLSASRIDDQPAQILPDEVPVEAAHSMEEPHQKKKSKKSKTSFVETAESIPQIQDDVPNEDTGSDGGANSLDEMLARKLNQQSQRGLKDNVHDIDSDDSATLEAMLTKKLQNKKSRRASQSSVTPPEQDVHSASPHGTTTDPFSDMDADGADSYHLEEDVEFDVKNDDIDIGSPSHEYTYEENELQDVAMSDQGSIDLDQTEHVMEARSFNESLGEPDTDNRPVGDDYDDDLDNETGNAFHYNYQNSDPLRDGSPILEGTPREVRESSIPRAREPTPELPTKKKKRKHSDASGDANTTNKKKKKVDVRHAQQQWENRRPSMVNGFTPINGSPLPVNGNSSSKNGNGPVSTNYESDSSSGSDASIPAVVAPKPKKTPQGPKVPKNVSKKVPNKMFNKTPNKKPKKSNKKSKTNKSVRVPLFG